MKKTQKMNFLYKFAFILLILCIPLFIISLIIAYLLEQEYFSIVFSAGGSFLAFFGIIISMFSKPKKYKHNKIFKDEEIINQNIDNKG